MEWWRGCRRYLGDRDDGRDGEEYGEEDGEVDNVRYVEMVM